jgi:DNA-binding IclR family transcriptional regulator
MNQQDLSLAIFGSRHALAIAVAIAESEDGRFTIPDVATAVSLPTSTIHALLKRLGAAQLVRRRKRETMPGARIAVYERAEHPIWAFAIELHAEAQARAEGTFSAAWATEVLHD